MASRRSRLSTSTKRQGWLRPTEGEHAASSISDRTARVDGIGLEAAYVAAPEDEVAQSGAEICVKARRGVLFAAHAAACR